MFDRRSKVATASVVDAERMYASLMCQLTRMRVMLGDIESSGRTKVKMQYWISGVEAEKKLDVFVRGIESSK